MLEKACCGTLLQKKKKGGFAQQKEGCECRGVFVASGGITVPGLGLQNFSYGTALWAFRGNLFSFGTPVPSRSRRDQDHGSDVMELC